MEEISIYSLSDFINEIEKYPSVKYLFRGEPQYYKERTASALRQYEGNYGDSDKIYPFQEMLDNFYREVVPKISNLEHDNFIAFAQHYGIPTTLVDITRSPLVALYFACQNSKKNKGYIHIFEDSYIDITKIVQKYPNKNIIEELFINSENDYLLLLPLFENYRNMYEDEFISNLETLFEEFIYFFSSSFSDTEAKLLKELSENKPYLKELSRDTDNIGADNEEVIFDNSNLHLWSILAYLKELDPEMSDLLRGGHSNEAIIYLNLMKEFFRRAYDYGEPIWWINFLPNMIYDPIMKFERGLSQSGLFLYQSYASYVEPAYDFRVQMVQRIQSSDTVFVVNNKLEILESLDNIGINKMTIFKDFDNTASYLKNKSEQIHGFE